MAARIKSVVSGLCMVLVAFIMIFPIYWVLASSFKPQSDIFHYPPSLIPKTITTENYGEVFANTNFPRYFLNSTILVSITVFFVLIFASMAAYAVSRYRFKGKMVFFLSILASQMLPVITLMIPLYMFWSGIGARNSYLSLSIVYIGGQMAISIWLITGYFQGIPGSIDEAAIIDGCSRLRILFQIIMPLAKPGLIAASMNIIVSIWQELVISTTFITNDTLKTIPSGLYSFITHSGIRWGPLTAASMVTLIPILIIYLFSQRYLVSGLTSGAVKG